MKQSLSHAVIYIDHLRKVRIFSVLFADGFPLQSLSIIFFTVKAELSYSFGNLDACKSYDFLMIMGIHVILFLDYHAKVQDRRVNSVVHAGAAHIYDALLKTNDGSCGCDCHALQAVGYALSCFLHVLSEQSRKDFAAFVFGSGLNDILDRHDPHGFSRSCDVKGYGLYPAVFKDKLLKKLRIHVKNSVNDL